MNVPLRCRCGELEGNLAAPEVAQRAVCYCRDCRAFARFLGAQEQVLDGRGGSDIIATLPRHVHITKGADRLACMSLSDKGLYRWYASCCRTPIANTPRNPKFSYVGIPVVCIGLPPAQVERTFGAVRVVANTASATDKVAATTLPLLGCALRVMKNTAGALYSGAWRENPFFRSGTARPVAAPRVLSKKVRAMLTDPPGSSA